jgi:ribosomal protein S4
MLNHVGIQTKNTKKILSPRNLELFKTLLNISRIEEKSKKNYSFESTNKVLYNSYILYKSPLNLLFSIDQFFFQFAKKFPQRKKTSEFKLQLKERKKLSLFYGSLSKKQLSHILNESNLYIGHTSKKVLSLLERRLDVTLYRSNFVKNIITARQYILHKKILVNNKCITIPSYRLGAGDLISITPKNFEKIGSNLLERLNKYIRQRDSIYLVSADILKKWAQTNLILSQKNLKFFLELLVNKISVRSDLIISQSPFYNLVQQNNLSTSHSQYFLIFNLKTTSLKQNYSFSMTEKQNILSPKIQLLSFSNDIEFFNNRTVDQTNLKNISEYYRNLLLQIILGFNYGKNSRELFFLTLTKYLTKKRTKRHALNALKIAGIKPLNLEISYKLLKIVFLYSPQRIYYPFFIDIDLIKRSYKK